MFAFSGLSQRPSQARSCPHGPLHAFTNAHETWTLRGRRAPPDAWMARANHWKCPQWRRPDSNGGPLRDHTLTARVRKRRPTGASRHAHERHRLSKMTDRSRQDTERVPLSNTKQAILAGLVVAAGCGVVLVVLSACGVLSGWAMTTGVVAGATGLLNGVVPLVLRVWRRRHPLPYDDGRDRLDFSDDAVVLILGIVLVLELGSNRAVGWLAWAFVIGPTVHLCRRAWMHWHGANPRVD